MGQVYRATDSALERTVAVKLLSDRYLEDEDARARFRREALAAARLSRTPNVVTVFDVAEHHGRPLIVMEYLEGGSVYERLREGRVPREEAIAWLVQSAAALDEAHAHGIVHRDVKPANLLLDGDGQRPRLRLRDRLGERLGHADSPGMVLGTAGYLAPEQARGEPATAASDRYALGVVAFELLTGRRPYEGDTPTTEAFGHLHAEIPSATSLDPTLPDACRRRVPHRARKGARGAPCECARPRLHAARGAGGGGARALPRRSSTRQSRRLPVRPRLRHVPCIARGGGASHCSWVPRRLR